MLFGRTPTYRPDKQEIYRLISALCDGENYDGGWSLFISIPVLHDPDLENIRLQCYELELRAEENREICFGSGIYRYNDVGIKKLQLIRRQLKSLIDNEPAFRIF